MIFKSLWIFVKLCCPAGEPWLWAPPVSAIRDILIMMMRRSPGRQSLTAGHAVTVPESDWPSQESKPSLRRLRRRSGVRVRVTVTMPVSLASRHRRTPGRWDPGRRWPDNWLLIYFKPNSNRKRDWSICEKYRDASSRRRRDPVKFQIPLACQSMRSVQFRIQLCNWCSALASWPSINVLDTGWLGILASKTINLMDIYHHYRRINWWGFEIRLKSTSFGGHEVCNYFHQLLDHF